MENTDLSKFKNFIQSHISKNPKSDKEILAYLKPYTEIKGIRYPTLVVHRYYINELHVEIDMKRAFNEHGGSSRIKSYLRRNQFKNDMGVWRRKII